MLGNEPNGLTRSLLPDPVGSHMFPEGVLIEELGERLDNIWDECWLGSPKEHLQKELQKQPSEKGNNKLEKQRSWLQRKFKSVWQSTPWAKRPSTLSNNGACEDFQDLIGTMIPRYPSWVPWDDDEMLSDSSSHDK